MRGDKVMFWIGGVMVGMLIIYALCASIITSDMCSERCLKDEALTYDVKSSGGWNTDDYCTCYFTDRSETFQMEPIMSFGVFINETI